MNIDDPLEAASVHFINGVWGLIACAIFDMKRGFCSGSPQMGEYLGVQIYGALAISAWAAGCALLFFIPCYLTGWLKYHPVIELIGVPKLKNGDFTKQFLEEMRK